MKVYVKDNSEDYFAEDTSVTEKHRRKIPLSLSAVVLYNTRKIDALGSLTMKLSVMIGERFKEQPNEAVLASHSIMIRGGYIRQVTQGIFTLLPPTKRIALRIEQILREEMDGIGAQEVMFPVVLPRELWEESGRYASVGPELMRFKDRNNHDMVLGMTHEEASVHLCINYLKSHSQLPFAIYQIQTKFRDEPRSRGGLIRVREFTMKDGYSFHTSQESLQEFYDSCFDAYVRIYKRVGLPQVVAVKSDTGMMGGSYAHEFMLLCDAGEDTIVTCNDCDYHSNMEVAEGILPDCGEAANVAEYSSSGSTVEEVYTPDVRTIEDLAVFLNAPKSQLAKAVLFEAQDDGRTVVAFIRGDLEVNEAKLRRYLKTNIVPAGEEALHGSTVAGFIGPLGLDRKHFEVIFDTSLKGMSNLVTGANKQDYHIKGFSIERDYPDAVFTDIAKVTEGSTCKLCGGKLSISRGIEVGNIFQLGTKYSESMGMKFTDKDGTPRSPIMGSYGIGVGRLIASVVEAYHDDNGPIWPISIAPWQVHICALRLDDEEVRSTAFALYEDLTRHGVEVIIDDRNETAGVQFADADLLGVPIRVIVSPRNLKDHAVEMTTRNKSVKQMVPTDQVYDAVHKLISDLYAAME